MSWNGQTSPIQIGIFGGTFDPPHLGHLTLAGAARHELGLERVLWVLTPDPPHKRGRAITPYPLRLKMLHAALNGQPGFEISLVDIERPGPHYALDTVNILARQHSQASLIYLMGGDSLRDLPKWQRAAELVATLSALAVLQRSTGGVNLTELEEQLPGIRAKIKYLGVPHQDVSASDIRGRIADGHSYRQFLPAGVAQIIEEYQLYRTKP